jgi:hypothetical protein
MVKSRRLKRHNKKHRGGEGEANSVLNMDETASAPATSMAPVMATASAPEEEKKSWFNSLFGGSRTKRVRFKMTRKHKRSSSKRSGHKRSSKQSGHKRSGHKRSSSKKMRKSSLKK